MLHNHASVLLDDDDDVDLHQTNGATAAADAAVNEDDECDGDRIRLLIVGGGGNCFSFGTHFNPQPMMLTIR